MMQRALRAAAIAACLGMLGLQLALQTVLTPGRAAPWPLFVLFAVLWAFGAAMLVRAPTFGAWGTTAWGLLAAAGAWRTHGAGWEDAALIGGSLLTAALAAAYGVARWRSA